jgi:DNA-binding PadR family transcriptional regulator
MVNYGSIYPALKKLKREGLVIARRESSKPIGRITYEITEGGRREFLRILRERIRGEPHVRDEFTLHLFFLDHLEKREVKELFSERLRGNQRMLEELLRKENFLKEVLPRYRFSAIERGILHIKAEVEWLKKIMEEIR